MKTLLITFLTIVSLSIFHYTIMAENSDVLSLNDSINSIGSCASGDCSLRECQFYSGETCVWYSCGITYRNARTVNVYYYGNVTTPGSTHFCHTDTCCKTEFLNCDDCLYSSDGYGDPCN